MPEDILRVENVCKDFNGLVAVNDCSFSILRGSITALIGPNGAGKTTTFNLIAGAVPLSSGAIIYDGKPIQGKPTETLFHEGIVRTFQITREFPDLTVLENLMVVPAGQSGERMFQNFLARQNVARQDAENRAKAASALEFLGLSKLRNELAGNLSGGQKKLLEIGRTMMTDARLVLLDEPGAGVNPTLMRTIRDMILRLQKERGYTFCIIEHDMDLIASLCDPIIVMAEGRVLTEGTMQEVRANREVLDAYLGGSAA